MAPTLLRLPTFLLVSLLAPTAFAATVHVDGSSTDPVQDGSTAHPYHAIDDALSASAAGDTIDVAAGTYVEALSITKAVTIVGAPHLQTVIEPMDSWELDAIGIELRSLAFQGLGAGTAVEATRPFVLTDSQIQDFAIGIRTLGVAGNTTIAHNRIVGNTHGLVLSDSGWSNYLLIENNLISGSTAGFGIAAFETRFRAYHNAIVEQWVGLYDSLAPARNLPISYARNNLIVAGGYGVYGYNIDANELKVWANAIEAPNPVVGIVASDELWTVASDCGATAGELWDHGFEPAAACVDAGVFAGDPDGSAADIGLYGGPQGGAWWQDFGCRGPHVMCPAELMTQWLDARPDVRAAMVFYDGGAWNGYDGWTSARRDELQQRFTEAWYDIETPLAYPPPNLLDPGPTDSGAGVHGLDDAAELYLSNVAHSMLTELDGRVPWTLDDYDAQELALLLDARTYYADTVWCADGLCIPENLGLRVRHNWGFPAPGGLNWAFMESDVGIGVDRLQTIANSLEWSRDNLFHFAGGLSQAQSYEYYWDYAGPVPALSVMDGTDPEGLLPNAAFTYDAGFGHWTAGCHGTNMLLQSFLRAANIPVEYVHPHHATPHFPSEGKWLTHGDDPYNGMADADYPAELMLIDDATYDEWFTFDRGNGWDNVGRRIRELAAIYLPASLQTDRCDDFAAGEDKASGSVFGYLSGAYSLAELDAMGFWVAIDTEIAASGECVVPMPLGSA